MPALKKLPKGIKKKTFEVGDIITDNFGRMGIVTQEYPPPSREWLNMQWNGRLKRLSKHERWYLSNPLSGGAAIIPASLSRFLRKATLKDLKEAYKGANSFAKTKLKKLFPNLKAALKKK